MNFIVFQNVSAFPYIRVNGGFLMFSKETYFSYAADVACAAPVRTN